MFRSQGRKYIGFPSSAFSPSPESPLGQKGKGCDDDVKVDDLHTQPPGLGQRRDFLPMGVARSWDPWSR